jgi:hypothetical protein
MRLLFGSLLTLCLFAGCSLTPPKPSPCQGEFRPVNASAHAVAVSMSQDESRALCMKEAAHAYQG